MPREQINYPTKLDQSSFDLDGSPVHGEAWRDPIVYVSWQGSNDHAGHVQLALGCPPAYVKSATESQDTSTADVDYFTGVLDREQINKLIRTLRRARDQAYGQDA